MVVHVEVDGRSFCSWVAQDGSGGRGRDTHRNTQYCTYPVATYPSKSVPTAVYLLRFGNEHTTQAEMSAHINCSERVKCRECLMHLVHKQFMGPIFFQICYVMCTFLPCQQNDYHLYTQVLRGKKDHVMPFLLHGPF